MPQMAPLSWLSLFIMFSLIFLMFNSMNYFTMTYSPKINLIKKTFNLTNWKW
nr:ATP synthase F0 subunit 8 [Holotrichia parallela]